MCFLSSFVDLQGLFYSVILFQVPAQSASSLKSKLAVLLYLGNYTLAFYMRKRSGTLAEQSFCLSPASMQHVCRMSSHIYAVSTALTPEINANLLG
jgi:hypothetical protein